MPVDNNEKEVTRASYYAALAKKFATIKVSKKDEPDFFRLQELLNDEKKYAANKDEITALAYKYVTENRVDSVVLFRYEKFDYVMALLAVCDKHLAEKIERDMNDDENLKITFEFRDHFAGFGKKRPVDSTKIYQDLKIRPLESEREPISEASNAQTRIYNLKILYKVLTKDATSIFHFNTSEYKRMVSSIKAVMDYSELGPEAMDNRVLNALFKNVTKQTADYISKKEAAPGSPLGQARLAAAFGVLQTTDRAKFNEMLKENNKVRRKEFREGEQMHIDLMGFASGNKFEPTTIESIVQKNQIEKILTSKEQIKCLNEKMKDLQERINAPFVPNDRKAMMAQYIGYKALIKILKTSDDFVPTEQQFEDSVHSVYTNTFMLIANKHLNDVTIDMEAFTKEVLEAESKQKEPVKKEPEKKEPIKNVEINQVLGN